MLGSFFTFGEGCFGALGHGGEEDGLVPRLLDRKKVIGAAPCDDHVAAWTEAGELFTFGEGYDEKLGHRGTESESALCECHFKSCSMVLLPARVKPRRRARATAWL
jgi:hypothetical protein